MEDDVEVQEQILYDLSVHCEWKLESETVVAFKVASVVIANPSSIVNVDGDVRNFREKKNVTLPKWISSMGHRIGWTVLRSVGVNAGPDIPCLLPVGLLKLVNSHLHWLMDVTQDGKHVALLEDQDLEIRSSFDEFSSVTGKASLSKKDHYPQWRRVAWNPDGDMVACSDSLGQVFIYDLFCTPICNIPCGWTPQPNAPIDLSRAICALIFKRCTNDKKWNWELIVVNYQGTLKKYFVSRDGDHELVHSFTFSSHYPKGIGAVLYQEKSELLLVGGCGDQEIDVDTPDSQKYGLSSWRMLSDSPHYKIVTDYEQDLYEAHQKRRVMRRLKSMARMSWWYGGKEEDGICGLALSPNGQTLASLHHSGRLSLWDIPSLRLRKTWALDEQPNYDEVNQNIAENPKKRKMMKEHLKAFWLADTNWWSDQAVILSRGTGAVTVASADSLHNLLGESPQWFEPAPILTKTHNGGFLSLECHCKYQSLKRHLSDSDGSGSEDEYEDSEDESDLDLIRRSTRMVKNGLYYVTDIERFQPPRKRPKLVNRTYRLLCLKSTTPDELYTKRINNEEYGEALALAKAYGLDCDRVYKRQWEKTPVSVASIQDYLSKISKRSWVLHECLERVPRNIDAMRELLKYGLRGTDLEALITIGKGEDHGRFIFCDRGDVYEESIDFYDVDAQEDVKQLEKQRINEQLTQIDFNKLTLEQRELCRARIKLLQFLDRLSTYEEVLGGIHAAEERYDHKFFETFRSKNIVDLALDYTRKCDWRAVETLFSYHGNDLLPYYLAIVANFPETFPPSDYRSLLPEVGSRPDDPEVLKWVEYQWREPDWVEYTDIRKAIDPLELALAVTLYEECPDYVQFEGRELTKGHLTKWYIQRATEIESFSRQVDYSLELVNLGIERGVHGLEVLQDDLVTMETLVYDCQIDDSLSLDDIQHMPDIDKIRLMMSRSSEEMYVKNVRRWLVPFLERCAKNKSSRIQELLREYMVTMAMIDLNLCLKIFETSKSDLVKPVISDEQELIALALECIYTCQAKDQLSNAFGILECLPQKGYGFVSESLSRLHTQIDELECHLSAAEILEKHQMSQTLAFFKNTQNDQEAAVQLLTKLLRVSGRQEPVLVEEDWRDLLKDMLSLRDRVYRNLPTAKCYQIFVESLLMTGRHEDIQLAGKMMECSQAEAQEPDYMHLENKEYGQFEKVSYKRAVELVLTAASEYFDASSNLSDSNMELARACLGLVKDAPAKITEELDLIDSLSLLDGFGVKVLPVQVRMSSNRIELVKKAVYEKPYTYKNSQRLLKLASLLHISGAKPSEVEGQVLKLITQCALEAGDLVVGHENCERLMQMGYAPVWEECKQLAQREDFSNIRAKTDLLAFAVTYCTPEMIEPILNAKCLLETQISYERVQEQLQQQGGRDSQSPPPKGRESESQLPPSSSGHRSVSGALQQTRDILSTTNKATRSMLSHVSDKTWWKKTLTSINLGRQVSHSEEKDNKNIDFHKTGCHPFYAGVIENAYENKSEADNIAMRLPAAEQHCLSLSELILRTGKQEETLTEGESFQPANDVILQLAESCVKEDAALGLAYLLSLPQPDSAEQCLNKQPRTAISLQLATYYYALQIYQWIHRDEGSKGADVNAVYLHSPAEIMSLVIRLVKKGEVKGCEELVSKLRLYYERLLDYTQTQKLKRLAKGVDLERFTVDDEYKKETILGLAMNSEQSVYDLSQSLAKRYNIPVWEVYITQLEALFESGFTLDEIEKRVTHLDILRSLKSKPEDFYSRMTTYVFPGLAGTDHDMLLYYYSLLEGCTVPQGEAEPQQHVKLLRKISGIASDLDYKKLIDKDHSPLEVIRSVLTSENIHQMAKLASKIPIQEGGYLQPSLVFCAWALRHFWEGSSTGKKAATMVTKSPTEWIHRYESCHEYVGKLSAEDMLQFVDGVLFTEEALKKLSLDCRQEILKRTLKFSKQQKNKNKATEKQWSVTIAKLTEYQDHLQLLCSEYLLEMWDSEDEQEKNYAQSFDLSRSNKPQVESLLVQMAIDGRSAKFIQEFLQEVTVTGWSVATVYRETLGRLTECVRNNDTREGESSEMKQLRTVVDSISQSIKDRDDFVSLGDVMVVLRPFCADATVDVTTRLSVLQTLEQSFQLDEGDLGLLLLYRTDAIVTSQWPGVKISEAEVSADSEREACFYRLLGQSEKAAHITALARLLQVWPPLEALTTRSGDPERYPYCELVKKLVCVCESKEAAATQVVCLLKSVKDAQDLSTQCVSYIFETLCAEHLDVTAVKSALLFEHKQPHEKVIEKLHAITQAAEDQELTELILKCHLLSSIVTTSYYPAAVQYVLSRQEGDVPYYLNMDNLANELHEAGFQAEAGSLLMEYRGMHRSLRTFGMAMTAVSRWFHK